MSPAASALKATGCFSASSSASSSAFTSAAVTAAAPAPAVPATSLFAHIPPDIVALRLRLFLMEKPVELSPAQWDQVWPYIDNIWVWNKVRVSEVGVETIYYLCRKHTIKIWVPSQRSGPQQRQKISQEALDCGMKLKVVKTTTSVLTTHSSEDCVCHCHDLELLNYQKKNSTIMTMAADQAAQGYKIAEVSANLTGKH